MEAIANILYTALGFIMSLCYKLLQNYGLSIILFTLITKFILFPINILTQKNSIKMINLLPEQNALKIKYIDDKDKYTDEQLALYKRHKYNPMLGIVPLLIQIPLVLGLVGVIYRPLSYVLNIDNDIISQLNDWLVNVIGVTDAKDMYQLEIMSRIRDGIVPDGAVFSDAISKINGLDTIFLGLNLSLTPSFKGNYELLLIPLLSGLSAWFLCVMQNKFNVLQMAQGNLNKWGTTVFMILFSTYFAFLVPAGVGLYWIFGNLFAVPSMFIMNVIIPPKKYVDYEYLKKMQEQCKVKEEIHRKNSKREKADYKRFFAVEDMKLMFYSESNGFYKYYAGMIDYITEHSDIQIHYVTSDPEDKRFNDPREQIHAYYVASDKYLIPLFMKLNCKMCIMTTPDLEKYHIKRSRLRNDIEYVYTEHGMGSPNLTLRKGALNWYDTVFVAGPDIRDELREIEELYDLRPKRIVEAGYMLLDDMVAEYEKKEHVKNERPKILIAPSWQPDNIIDLCIEDILATLADTDYDIIVRSHPQQYRHSPERFEELKNKYEHEDGNITVQTDFSSHNPVLEADILITDWSDISFEFAFTTKKPVLFIDTPMKIMNAEYEKIKTVPRNIAVRNVIGKSVPLDKLDSIDEEIADMLNRQDEYRDAIEEAFHKYIYNIGKSKILCGRYVIKSLTGK